eukprot:1356827-Amphidinium_carterae.3
MAEEGSDATGSVAQGLEVGTFFKQHESLPTKTAQQQQSKRRKLARCETDELCHKAIRDNFKNWSHTACFEVKNKENLTLFEKLKRDKHERRHNPECTIKFGPGYYQSLRYEFADLDAPVNQLTVTTSTEEILERIAVMMKQPR